MRNIFTFFFFCVPLLILGQINIGNNQTICLGDTAEIIANVQTSGQCVGMDTVICGLHSSNFTSTLTRGFHFQAQSSFIISGLMCAIENSGPGYNQSVQVVAFGDSIGGVWNPMAPSGTVPFTTLFSSIDDSTADYIFCNISVDSGQYYGVLGARHVAGAGSAGQVYNSYSTTAGATVVIDGNTTLLSRLYYQSSLSGGVAPTGSFYGTTTGQIGRVHMLTGGGVRWYDVNTGVRIGYGDTLYYAPSQTTFVAGLYECAGQTYADTMNLNITNTQINTTGLSLCDGPITLTAASGFALYVWNNNSASPQLSVNTPGTYYVNCTNSNGSVCQSPSITIYADTIPVAISPPDTTLVCPGDTVYLQLPLGYSSYLWNTGSSNQSILADSTGSYWAYALDGNGCVAASDTAQIVTNELQPDIWSDVLSLCTSSPVIFFNRIYTDPIYQSYQWGTNTTLFPSTSSSQSGTQPGNYWVTVTDQFGCSGTSDTITILSGNFHFDLLPSDSIFLCNAGSNVTLDAGTVGVNQQITYLWNTGATTPTINVNTPSTYYCVAMMPSGCYGFSDTVKVSGINPPLSYSGLSLCSGPVSLNTSNYSSYQWSNSSTTQSLSVNQAGDYFVFVTDSNGCTAYSDTVSIYTNAFQYNIIPSGSTTICSGYTVDLDAGNQFTNHQWNTGANTATITASSIGQYYASMIDVNGCSGYTDTIDVTNLSVNISTTGYSLCNPSAYPFIDAGSGYYSYNWSTGDTTSAINVALPGDYYVTVIDENGCTASSDTITIYLNTFAFNINAIGTDSICQPSGQVTLDATNNYFSYNWSTGAITQQVTVNAAGNYTVDVMDMNGCNGTSNPFTVHNVVLTSNITGQISALENTVENYTVSANSTSTYNWNVTGGTLQSGQGTNIVDVLWATVGQGSIYVIETDANGCIGDTISLIVTITQQPSNINEEQADKINIYPNPFTKSTLISLSNTIADYKLNLYDITGQKVLAEDHLTTNTYKLERGVLSKGVYFLEIKTNTNRYIKRVVVD
jgi:hypothetical protein